MWEEIDISMEQASDAKVLIISVAARLAGMHPQTLRQYDRLGLVQPGRTGGGGRRYSQRDVALLREVQRLSQEDGVNLAGIKRIIGLEQLVGDLQERVAELERQLDEAYTRIAQLEAVVPYTGRDLVRKDLLVVEELGAGHQHPAVVCPDRHRLVADLLGAFDVLLQPTLALRGRIGTDAVGGVDVHAVLGEPAGRTLPVHGQLEQRRSENVTGDQQIPVRRHRVQRDRLGVIRPCL